MEVQEPSTDVRLEQLAREHLDLVYAAALRQLDEATAQDVAQAVMLILIRKARAGKLPEERFMSGWLLKVTRYAVLQARRAAGRRSRRESLAPESAHKEEASAGEVRAALDACLLDLGTLDREAVVRRYLRGESFAEVGRAMGASENTAGRRVARALEKLRKMLRGKGIVAPAAVLMGVLGSEAAVKAPAACAEGLGSAGTPVLELAKQVSWKMVMAKIQTAAMAVLGAAAVAGAVGAGTVRLSQPAGTPTADAGRQIAAPASANWEPRPMTVEVAGTVEESSDRLVAQVLADLEASRKKLRSIHVTGSAEGRMKVSSGQWEMAVKTQGEGWAEAGSTRRVRLDVGYKLARSFEPERGVLGPPEESSFLETWDGVLTRVLYRQPYSIEGARTYNVQQLQGDAILGRDFSSQLSWEKETNSDASGTRTVFDRDPLSPDTLALAELTARRVNMKGADGERAELTVTFPDKSVDRKEVFWFDSKRGYAVVARVDTLGVKGTELRRITRVVDAVQEAAPGVFYPTRGTMMWEERSNAFLYVDYRAEKVLANEPIEQAKFSEPFPRGIEVVDFVNGIGKTRAEP